MEKMTKQDGKSLDMVKGNLEALKTIFPEAFTEDGVNFETLRQLLGDEVDDGEEKYGLNWHGKKKARQIALTPSLGTLRPCPEESVDWNTTQNLFIEGDNLEVLKLLQKSYANKVKMIYIDPPYNTGKEFIYPDKFQDNLDTYLKYTGQKDDEGFKVSSNTESSGRYHTNWLNMIYPRLKLARNLLRDDGVIFISIDDNESTNLRIICNDIFGEENFIGSLIWKRRVSSAMADNNVSSDHDYVVCYQKGNLKGFAGFEKDFKRYSNPDNDKRGPWISDNLTVGMNSSMRPNQAYDLVDPKTGSTYPYNPNRVWAFIPETMNRMIAEGRIIFPDDPAKRPMQKRFQNELNNTHNPFSTLMLDRVGLNTEATRTIQDVMERNVFEYSKPVSLLKTLVPQICVSKNDIVLDFFAGSCVTAHAVLDLNKDGDDNLKFVMVQLPEPCDEKSEAFKGGYKTIADIGKERIRRVAAKIKEETPLYQGDLGFKVFKLDSSNIQTWNPDRDDLEQTLLDHADHLVEGRSEEDVLYELLLKRGVDLTVPIEQKEVSGKAVYSIGYGVLFTCLDTSISRDDVESLAQGIVAWHEELKPESDTQVVFRDSAFADDIAKTNMTAILEQNGIAHVRSL
ncbi:MAG: site-specific DNA-methyltransferase [Nitrospinota bacterium]|nr:site-specific DNA-methyltransferase [Nitrospinota bacterium]